MSLHEADAMMTTALDRLSEAADGMEGVERLVRGTTTGASRAELLVFRAGLEGAAESGEAMIAAGAALRRWAQRMLVAIDHQLAQTP